MMASSCRSSLYPTIDKLPAPISVVAVAIVDAGASAADSEEFFVVPDIVDDVDDISAFVFSLDTAADESLICGCLGFPSPKPALHDGGDGDGDDGSAANGDLVAISNGINSFTHVQSF